MPYEWWVEKQVNPGFPVTICTDHLKLVEVYGRDQLAIVSVLTEEDVLILRVYVGAFNPQRISFCNDDVEGYDEWKISSDCPVSVRLGYA